MSGAVARRKKHERGYRTATGHGLRPVQTEGLEALAASLLRGNRRILMVMPTGAGKTVTFANAPRILREIIGTRTKRVLVLAHRGELLVQAKRTFEKWEPKARVGLFAGGTRCDPEAMNVVIAGVNTIGRPEHLARLRPDLFDFIVIDEAHHAVAGSAYQRIVAHFNGFEATGPIVTGWTATPHRADGKRLTTLFEDNPYAKGLADGMREGWLAPARWVPVHIGADLLSIGGDGDYDQGKLAHLMNQPAITCTMIARYLQITTEMRSRGITPKTIVFTVNTAHAIAVVEALRETGISAEFLGASLRDGVKQDVLARFRDRQYEAVVSMNLLLEGFDDDQVNVALDLKPTRSAGLAAQEFGRPIRYHKDKLEAIYIQAVPEHAEEAKMVTVPKIFEIDINWDTSSPAKRRCLTDGPIHEAVERLEGLATAEALLGELEEEEAEAWSPEQRASFIARALTEHPESIVQLVEALPPSYRDSDVIWSSRADHTFAIHLDGQRLVKVHPADLLGRHRITFEDASSGQFRLEDIGADTDVERARVAAEAWVYRNHPISGRLFLKSLAERWMREPATEAQKVRVRRLLPNLTPEQLDLLRKGVASRIISYAESQHLAATG